VETVRVDRWLCAARIFKSRTQATQGCSGGHVKLNGKNARPGQLVRVGDSLEVRRGERLILLEVTALAEKRLSPAAARELYQDHSPPPPPRRERVAERERGAGRPSKRDLRLLRRLRGDR
jgi:ribosome-associated heat shock protein Hsp15